MQLTLSDAMAISATAKHIPVRNDDLITDSELVTELLYNLYKCETNDGIKQCISAMPRRVWSDIEARINETLGEPYLAEHFVFKPSGLTETELERLAVRLRRIIAIIAEYLVNPTDNVQYEIDDPNGLRQQWFLFKHLETVAGELCRKADCAEERIRKGVFCRAHHLEIITRQLPGDVDDSS